MDRSGAGRAKHEVSDAPTGADVRFLVQAQEGGQGKARLRKVEGDRRERDRG